MSPALVRSQCRDDDTATDAPAPVRMRAKVPPLIAAASLVLTAVAVAAAPLVGTTTPTFAVLGVVAEPCSSRRPAEDGADDAELSATAASVCVQSATGQTLAT